MFACLFVREYARMYVCMCMSAYKYVYRSILMLECAGLHLHIRLCIHIPSGMGVHTCEYTQFRLCTTPPAICMNVSVVLHLWEAGPRSSPKSVGGPKLWGP